MLFSESKRSFELETNLEKLMNRPVIRIFECIVACMGMLIFISAAQMELRRTQRISPT